MIQTNENWCEIIVQALEGINCITPKDSSDSILLYCLFWQERITPLFKTNKQASNLDPPPPQKKPQTQQIKPKTKPKAFIIFSFFGDFIFLCCLQYLIRWAQGTESGFLLCLWLQGTFNFSSFITCCTPLGNFFPDFPCFSHILVCLSGIKLLRKILTNVLLLCLLINFKGVMLCVILWVRNRANNWVVKFMDFPCEVKRINVTYTLIEILKIK